MTEDRALSILRAKGANSPDTGLVVVRKFQPTPSTKRVAQESLENAKAMHIELYGDGVFLDVLREGGMVVLEFDTKSDMATKLHVVTADATGEANVQSEDVGGGLKRDEALTIINRSVCFSEAFFSSPKSQMNELLINFGGPDAAAHGIPDGQGYLAIPEAVKGLTTRPGELLELTGLSNGLALWTIRHALAMPVYAANPIAAVQEANKELSNLVQQFRPKSGEKDGLDFADRLLDLDSIRTHDELEGRLGALRELSSFLDEHSPLPVRSAAYRVNISISLIPRDLAVETDAGRLYGVATAPGLMSGWNYGKSGELVLKGLSVAE